MRNRELAERFEEMADLLEAQGANPFRVRAYRRGASTLRDLDRPAAEIYEAGGLPALDALPGIGEGLAQVIQQLIITGVWPQLERLKGAHDPLTLFQTLPGVGPAQAHRLVEELHVDTLEALELAVHDGRVAALPGFGTKRVAALRDALAARLRRRPRRAQAEDPPVRELLDVDR